MSKRFKQYQAEVNRLLALAGIGGRYSITFESEDEDNGRRAALITNYMGCTAKFVFNDGAKGCARTSARHEFGHFLASGLGALAGDRYVTRDELRKEEESIAVVLERLLK